MEKTGKNHYGFRSRKQKNSNHAHNPKKSKRFHRRESTPLSSHAIGKVGKNCF